MTDPNQPLRELLGVVAGLCPEDDLFLIGGLAVHHRIVGPVRVEDIEQVATLAEIRESLPCLTRVTADIDVGVRATDLSRLDAGMRGQGFDTLRSRPPPQRYFRGSDRVDVISLPERSKSVPLGTQAELPHLVAALVPEFEAAPELGLRVFVATPLVLVILKCVAFDTRHEARDCVDISRLALEDRKSGKIRDTLPAAVQRLPRGVRESIRRTRQAFATPGGAAAGHLLRSLRDALRWDEDDSEMEYLLRQDISKAVSELLSLR